ncbi:MULTISPECIES: hypothetical protein [Spiribacter]|uniref:Uncharacterized protein n=2 Tax=Spiribacter TaxID=1335745 RepID=A0A557RHH4_9GAMM|nr:MULTISPECIES: hypothetical protein [Spiribacter]PZA00259.1 hypothetical protein A6K26_006015 [Gammaproteobacteria bacterium 2W06]AUB78707.1 hypothetical protein BBH56_06085 [Spiribacter roseus]KAF0280652.1 hypothetical protein BA897_08270 [Spiribacter roseus]KAF0282425.1 hypothetical protein BA900_04925 [Spiribacter roseus]KAF0284267.1 hypothetical protein BA898_07920 [Spiribacter roseus]
MNRSIDLKALSREALDALRGQIDQELEARAFEQRLRRDLESHRNRQAWIDSHHSGQRRRR